MALLLLVVTVVTCIATVDSATNVTSCTSLINDQCTQNLTSCPQPPCSLSCGRTSSQHSCIQDCIASSLNDSKIYQCDALECDASHFCDQTCHKIDCKSSTCTSRDCYQECWRASCGRMVCQANVTNCTQAVYRPGNGQIMDCRAKLCNQDVYQESEEFSSELTCSSAVEKCNQRGQSGKFNLTCLPGVKNCTQIVKIFSNANMQCDGDSCEQSCSYSTCNMSCSESVQECTQFEDPFRSSFVTMNCDADVCKQKCGYGFCNMTCSSNVKDCTQSCKKETCLTRCDAETCHRDFGIPTTAISQTPSSVYPINSTSTSWKSSSNFLIFCLVLILSFSSY